MNTLRIGSALVLLFLAGFNTLPAQAIEPAPNIVWIIAEDMSPDLSCYGNKLVRTPHIDKLASRGMRFTQAHVTAPACSPSRTSLATGVFQTTLGAHHMRYPEQLKPNLLEGIKTLPELLQGEGYNTGNVKNLRGLGSAKDDWQFKTSQPWDTKEWNKLTAKEPFFCQLNLGNTHRPFSKYANSKVDESAITLPPYYPDTSILRQDWASYLNDIEKVDAQVGAILQAIEDKGISENTIVVFLSDHGRPMLRGKNWLYDSGTRVPLVIFIPKGLEQPKHYQAASTSRQLISSIDLVAESARLAGVELPSWMQGKTFLSEGSEPREYLFSAIDRVGDIETCSRAIRSKKFKYIRNLKRPGSVVSCSTAYRRANHPAYHVINLLNQRELLNLQQKQLVTELSDEELYDLENDPFETRNLIGLAKYENVQSELQDKLDEWLKLSDDKGFLQDSEELKRHFLAYGKSTHKAQQSGINRMETRVKRALESRKKNPALNTR